MWTLAGRLRLSRTQAAHGWLLAVLYILCLSGCSRDSAPRQLLQSQCVPVSGAGDVDLSIFASVPGTLIVRVEEHGVSVVATLDGDPDSEATSPVERFGAIALVAETKRSQRHSLRIRTVDSPDIMGKACYSAQVHAGPATGRVAAEHAFMLAGRATHSQDWGKAFDWYAQAARQFDDLKLWRSSGATRHALTELAYHRFDRKRESYALAVQALADYRRASTDGGAADLIHVGLLTELEAKALIDSDVHANTSTIRALLAAARHYYTEIDAGARELPRLDIMTGFLEYMLDQPVRTKELFKRAAADCSVLKDWDCYAIANQNLALLAAESNNYAVALSSYADALRLLPPDLDPKLAADIWNNYGRVQGIVGLFSSSVRSHSRAMREYARLGDCQGVRRSLSLWGSVMVHFGTLSDAEDYLEKAASDECPELLAEDPDATVSRPLVTAHQPCARPLDPTTLPTDNKLTVFNSLLSLGGALMLEGEPELARRCYDAAGRYAVTARTQMRLANAQGFMLLEKNSAAAALASFEHSLKVADEAQVPATYEYRGAAHLGIVRATLLAGKPADAVDAAFAALKSSVSRGDIEQTVTSLRLLAAGLRGSGQLAEAARTLEVAARLTKAVPIDELDGEKRATYLATQHTVFAALTDLYASQAGADPAMRAEADLAFATSEEGRARSLEYAVHQARATSGQETPPSTRYQQLLHEVVNLGEGHFEPRPAALVDRLDAVARGERDDDDSFDRTQLTHALQQLDATLVEYAVGDRDMFAFVVNDDATHVVRLGDKRAIADATALLHDRLRDPEAPPAEISAAASNLAKRVFWPLLNTPGIQLTRKRIIFVPDDALHTVPLNVLPWSANAADKLILDHAEVSLAPSAKFLKRLHALSRAQTNAPRIELIGDPVFRLSDWTHECTEVTDSKPVVTQATRSFSDWTESLPRLPGTRAEVQMIAELARQSRSGSRIETYLGCAAVPSALRAATAGRVDLLHVATHARVDAQRPRLSALALTPESDSAPGSAAFGLLDILGLKLNSSLVVLSACDTSRGRLLPGEGVLGPAQAFLQSGAATVVASYWKVDDQTTSTFMRKFYRHLLLEHRTAAAALRAAQLESAASSPAHNWAAFALYGWPDTDL